MRRTNDSDEMTAPGAEILRADPDQRRKAQRLLAAIAVVAVLFWWVGLPALGRWINVQDVAVMSGRMAMVCYGLSALLLGTAGYCAWYARRILVASQFPPPGTWVLRDTRLLRGERARARGMWVIACAVSFAVLGVFSIFLPRQFDALLATAPMPLPLQHAAPITPPHG